MCGRVGARLGFDRDGRAGSEVLRDNDDKDQKGRSQDLAAYRRKEAAGKGSERQGDLVVVEA